MPPSLDAIRSTSSSSEVPVFYSQPHYVRSTSLTGLRGGWQQCQARKPQTPTVLSKTSAIFHEEICLNELFVFGWFSEPWNECFENQIKFYKVFVRDLPTSCHCWESHSFFAFDLVCNSRCLLLSCLFSLIWSMRVTSPSHHFLSFVTSPLCDLTTFYPCILNRC